LVRRGKLASLSRIVDIGSGCGRLAIPFSLLVKDGDYFGTDVFEEGINWCAKNISTRNPKFKFFLQEVENNYYFGGDIKPSDSLSLGFAGSGSIDFVFALSVFTHLVEADAERYFREIARCLNRGGVAYLTAFIIDKSFDAFVKRTNLHTAVREVSEGHYQAYEGQDFFAGYTFDRWRALIERSGLEISGFDPGTWAEKPGALHYQDTFIVTKRS
jgi:SAM-dependent methyltransferase